MVRRPFSGVGYSDGMAERSRGRPKVGQRVTVRLPDEMVDALDDEAKERGMTRAELIRQRLFGGVESGVDLAQIQRQLAMTPAERVRHMAQAANAILAMRENARRSKSS